MVRLRALLLWLAALIAIAAAVSAVLWQSWLKAAVLFAFALSLWPVTGARLEPRLRWAGAAALGGLALVLVFAAPSRNSIYVTEAARDRLLAIYAEKLSEWPVTPESRMIETRLGTVHVLSAGPSEAPPLLLLHASGVGSWSWGPNIAALAAEHRVHAVDLIGDAGRSVYADLSRVMQTGEDQAEHYAELMDALGLASAPVIGASEGGFIATNLAIHRPDRVERLILLGPMGYSGAVGAILRITLTQAYPVPAFQRATFAWAFSEDPGLQAEFGEWFPLVMSGTFPVKVAPLPFSAEERQRLNRPVMFVFGTRDRLVGNPETARALVQDIPGVRVEVLEAGHLMAAEDPETVNRLVLEFLSGD
jgi:pimeloyl-ACP methyl ester carboxylesterase